MFAGTSVSTDHAHEADVLYFGSGPPITTVTVPVCASRSVADSCLSTAAVSVAGAIRRDRSTRGTSSARNVHGTRCIRMEVRVVLLLVQVQGVVVGVPRRHQVAAAGRHGDRRRETGGGGAALIWKDV